jgi:drug efflux transport system permease protein
MKTPKPDLLNAERPGAHRLRLFGLMRKEVLQIRRDPSALGIAFALPIVLLILFGYGVSLNAERVRVAIVADERTAATQSFAGSFGRSKYFRPQIVEHMEIATELLATRKIDAIVHMQGDFAARSNNPHDPAPIQLIVNGVDANSARQVQGYVDGVWAKWLEHQYRTPDPPAIQTIVPETRIWYNEQLRSRNFLVPGLIAVIMTLIGALLTSMVVAREWERGTMESMLTTPVRVGEILLSKLIPYFLLGMGGMAISLATSVWLFEVPLRGSLLILTGAASLFMLAAVGMGLLISTIARSQFLAGHIAIVTTFLPAFILSGFIFDIRSMPLAIRLLTHIVPARYFVSILQSSMLAGDIPAILVPNAFALALMALIFLVLVRKRSTRLIG